MAVRRDLSIDLDTSPRTPRPAHPPGGNTDFAHDAKVHRAARTTVDTTTDQEQPHDDYTEKHTGNTGNTGHKHNTDITGDAKHTGNTENADTSTISVEQALAITQATLPPTPEVMIAYFNQHETLQNMEPMLYSENTARPRMTIEQVYQDVIAKSPHIQMEVQQALSKGRGSQLSASLHKAARIFTAAGARTFYSQFTLLSLLICQAGPTMSVTHTHLLLVLLNTPPHKLHELHQTITSTGAIDYDMVEHRKGSDMPGIGNIESNGESALAQYFVIMMAYYNHEKRVALTLPEAYGRWTAVSMSAGLKLEDMLAAESEAWQMMNTANGGRQYVTDSVRVATFVRNKVSSELRLAMLQYMHSPEHRISENSLTFPLVANIAQLVDSDGSTPYSFECTNFEALKLGGTMQPTDLPVVSVCDSTSAHHTYPNHTAHFCHYHGVSSHDTTQCKRVLHAAGICMSWAATGRCDTGQGCRFRHEWPTHLQNAASLEAFAKAQAHKDKTEGTDWRTKQEIKAYGTPQTTRVMAMAMQAQAGDEEEDEEEVTVMGRKLTPEEQKAVIQEHLQKSKVRFVSPRGETETEKHAKSIGIHSMAIHSPVEQKFNTALENAKKCYGINFIQVSFGQQISVQ